MLTAAGATGTVAGWGGGVGAEVAVGEAGEAQLAASPPITMKASAWPSVDQRVSKRMGGTLPWVEQLEVCLPQVYLAQFYYSWVVECGGASDEYIELRLARRAHPT